MKIKRSDGTIIYINVLDAEKNLRMVGVFLDILMVAKVILVKIRRKLG